MRTVGPFNSGDAAGVDGSATNNQESSQNVSGYIMSIYIRYNDSPPATTDVTIASQGTNTGKPPANTIFTKSNANTDGWFYPHHVIHDETGNEITYDGTNEIYEPIPIDDEIIVTIAGANVGDSVDVWMIIDD